MSNVKKKNGNVKSEQEESKKKTQTKTLEKSSYNTYIYVICELKLFRFKN